MMLGVGDKLHTKKQQKYMIFRRIMPNDVLYSCFESILTFNAKKNFKKNYQSYKHYLFNNFEEIQD